jgi:hypothetical protein
MTWLKIKVFCARYGIPESVVQRAIHSKWSKEIARKANQNANYNSPWLVNVEKFLELWEGGFI